VIAVVLVLHGLALAGIVGRKHLAVARVNVKRNVRKSWGVALVLAFVLVLNKAVRDVGVELSWLVGARITGGIYDLEGTFVASVQSLASVELTWFFGAMYVYGYVFLLTFPLVAYAIETDWRPLRELLVAYVVNYGVGLVCYVAFVAYGPRNFMPELVESLLYVQWPDVQLLTSRVNRNTNVFPSLHASLSVTVVLVASRYRSTYPRWLPVVVVFATSIALATVYLGIHWLTDVIAGVVLAYGAVAFARRYVARDDEFEPESPETTTPRPSDDD